MAGGVNDIGTLRSIKVLRKGRLVSTVDIYDYILNGKLTGNIRLTSDDVILRGHIRLFSKHFGQGKTSHVLRNEKDGEREHLD